MSEAQDTINRIKKSVKGIVIVNNKTKRKEMISPSIFLWSPKKQEA